MIYLTAIRIARGMETGTFELEVCFNRINDFTILTNLYSMVSVGTSL